MPDGQQITGGLTFKHNFRKKDIF